VIYPNCDGFRKQKKYKSNILWDDRKKSIIPWVMLWTDDASSHAKIYKYTVANETIIAKALLSASMRAQVETGTNKKGQIDFEIFWHFARENCCKSDEFIIRRSWVQIPAGTNPANFSFAWIAPGGIWTRAAECLWDRYPFLFFTLVVQKKSWYRL